MLSCYDAAYPARESDEGRQLSRGSWPPRPPCPGPPRVGGVPAAPAPGRRTPGGPGRGRPPPAAGGPPRAPTARRGVASAPAARGSCGRLAAPSMQGQGQERARARAVEPPGPPRDSRRTAPRATAAARQLRKQARRRPGRPARLPSAGRDAQTAARTRSTEAHGPTSASRPGRYGNQSVAQAQRTRQRGPRPRRGGKRWPPPPRPGGARTPAEAPATPAGRGGRGRGLHGGRIVRRSGRVISPETGATAPAWLPEQNVRQSPFACHRLSDRRGT